MEQHEIENQFREQLNSREIKPSEMAWEKLDAMLTVAEEKKPKRSYSWIYIAASIIGFAFLGTIFFSQSDKNETVENNEVVIGNSRKEPPLVISSNLQTEILAVISEEKTVKKNSRDRSSTLKTQNQVDQNANSDSLIPMIEKEQTIQKTEQFVSSNISDNAIDEMLAAVKTTSKAATSKTAIKVNPNTLLSQVDGELELSFREKVINKVNKNYQTVKVALANRNQE